MTYTVYAITHIESGLVYVGCTKIPIARRFHQHWLARTDGSPLHTAIATYGREAFSLRRLVTTNDRATAFQMERDVIRAMRCTEPEGLNAKAWGGILSYAARMVAPEGPRVWRLA